MTIQASGPIKFSDLQREFEYGNYSSGSSTPISLGSYRIREEIFKNSDGSSYTGVALTSYSISDGVPTSGTIKLSNFYSSKKTVIIEYSFASGTVASRDGRKVSEDLLARTTIGAGFTAYKICPSSNEKFNFSSPTGSLFPLEAKVIIVNKGFLGAATTSPVSCALHIDSDLNVVDASNNIIIETDVGSLLSGQGGRGGSGGTFNVAIGGTGGSGSSAIGLSTSIRFIRNRGRIQAGAGGGGGGAAAPGSNTNNTAGGGGGGGGAGYPGGIGGAAGSNASPGLVGSNFVGGSGGAEATRGSGNNAVRGGKGGVGGSIPSTGIVAAGIGATASNFITANTNTNALINTNVLSFSRNDVTSVSIGKSVSSTSAGIPSFTYVTAINVQGGSNPTLITISKNLTVQLNSGSAVKFETPPGLPGENGYKLVIAPGISAPTITDLGTDARNIGITSTNTIPTN